MYSVRTSTISTSTIGLYLSPRSRSVDPSTRVRLRWRLLTRRKPGPRPNFMHSLSVHTIQLGLTSCTGASSDGSGSDAVNGCFTHDSLASSSRLNCGDHAGQL